MVLWVISADLLKAPKGYDEKRVSPLTSKEYNPLIVTDYSSESDLIQLLEENKIDTVICAFALDFDAASESQLTLIRASESAKCVERFVPSEFNVDYDQPDDVLPYADKRFHTVARRELEKTRLEYTYIYSGMFMDYFGMPNIPGYTRALYLIVDPSNGVALVPGDGNAKMAVSLTKDVAYYLSRAIELTEWPRIMTVVSDTVTSNDLVKLIEGPLGTSLSITYQSVDTLMSHQNGVLPSNIPISEHFPEGLEQVKALTAALEASIALGAYDFGNLGEHLDLVARFSQDRLPTRVEAFLKEAWGSN